MMRLNGENGLEREGGSVLRSTEKLSDSTPPQGPAAWAEAWARIRAKLREHDPEANLILTHRGLGYSLELA